jgi:hypothetical protein
MAMPLKLALSKSCSAAAIASGPVAVNFIAAHLIVESFA